MKRHANIKKLDEAVKEQRDVILEKAAEIKQQIEEEEEEEK